MAVRERKYDLEEFARRGKSLYEERIRPLVEAGNRGKIVAIDFDSGEYAVADTTIAASDSLRSRLPDAQIWQERIGYAGVHHFGAWAAGRTS